MTSKRFVLEKVPKAVCLKCLNPKGYIVWKSKPPGPRGTMVEAIGFGRNAEHAWNDALRTLRGGTL